MTGGNDSALLAFVTTIASSGVACAVLGWKISQWINSLGASFRQSLDMHERQDQERFRKIELSLARAGFLKAEDD